MELLGGIDWREDGKCKGGCCHPCQTLESLGELTHATRIPEPDSTQPTQLWTPAHPLTLIPHSQESKRYRGCTRNDTRTAPGPAPPLTSKLHSSCPHLSMLAVSLLEEHGPPPRLFCVRNEPTHNPVKGLRGTYP